LTFEDPRAGVRQLLAEAVPLPARTLGLALMAVASALLWHFWFMLLPPEDPVAAFMSQSPLRTAVVQWVALAATVLLTFWIGRNFDGHGNLPDTLLVMVWLQTIMIALRVVQLLALVISPPIAMLLEITKVAVYFWLYSSFVAELHGFASRWQVFGATLGIGFGIALMLATVLITILGPERFAGV